MGRPSKWVNKSSCPEAPSGRPSGRRARRGSEGCECRAGEARRRGGAEAAGSGHATDGVYRIVVSNDFNVLTGYNVASVAVAGKIGSGSIVVDATTQMVTVTVTWQHGSDDTPPRGTNAVSLTHDHHTPRGDACSADRDPPDAHRRVPLSS